MRDVVVFSVWLICAALAAPVLMDRADQRRERNAVANLPRATLADLTGRTETPDRLAVMETTDAWYQVPQDRIAQDLVLGLGARPQIETTYGDEKHRFPRVCGARETKLVVARFSDGTRVYGFCDATQIDLSPLRDMAQRAELVDTLGAISDWEKTRADIEDAQNGWVLSARPDPSLPYRVIVELPWVWLPNQDDAPASLVLAEIAARLGDDMGQVEIRRREASAPTARYRDAGDAGGRVIQNLGQGQVLPARLVRPRSVSFVVTCATKEVCDRLDSLDPAAIAEPYRPRELLDYAVTLAEDTPTSFAATPAILTLLQLGRGKLHRTTATQVPMQWLRLRAP